MTLLEMRRAAYGPTVRAVSAMLAEREHRAFPCARPQDAAAVALLACGMLRPTAGTVFVGAFDTRIQPVQVKRIAAFVPHEPVAPSFASFNAYIEFRAALWGIAPAPALLRARAVLECLRGVHEAFAYPLAGALSAEPRLLVLDRPQAAYAAQIARITENLAVFSTHASEDEAAAFAREGVFV